MSEFLHDALHGLKEYLEWRKAPEEFARTVRAFGEADEEVLYKGYAQYLNQQSFLDMPIGVVVITNTRFLFLTKKKSIPFVKSTEHMNYRLSEISGIEATKYRLGSAYKFRYGGRDYMFLPKHMHTMGSMQKTEEVAQVLSDAKSQSR